ncbi:MAG: amidase, partial [Candidatus Rokuibacteriota bacterium]
MERDLWRWDAVELAAAIRTRRISSHEATRSVLERLAAVNPALNAVTVLLADEA